MKRIVVAGIAAAAVAFCGCGSSKATGDDYDGGGTPLALPSASRSRTQDGGDHYSAEKIRGGDKTFMEQLLGTEKFQEIDEVELNLRTMIGSVFSRTAALIYKQHTDMAGIYVLYDTSSYALYFAKEERNAFIRAVERYLEDFEEKKLDRNLRRSDRTYGNVGAYEEFGLAKRMLSNYAKPTAHFGYRFLNGNPYFCIYVASSPNLARTPGDGKPEKAVDQHYYFTRAQAQALADFLSDESIDPLYKPPRGSAEAEADADKYED